MGAHQFDDDDAAGDCFASGTLIATTRGPVKVESLHAGDRVCTVIGGDVAEVVWVGRREVNCGRHPDPTKVWPIRISANAFGRGVPATDLVLSPDHAVYADQVLIPIRLLVNGRTVRQVLAAKVTYHQIELTRHDVLLANGLPAESYLDTGGRSRFSNGGGVITLHPDFAVRQTEVSGCARLVVSGPVLDQLRRRLAVSAARRRRRPRDTFTSETTWPR